LNNAPAHIAIALILSSLTACEDDCSTYSMNRFNCSQIEHAAYGIHFTLPDNTELHLGETQGLSTCAAKASDYAKQHNVPKQYYCCMITEGSNCAEKHR
jgi:hypothetical protein